MSTDLVQPALPAHWVDAGAAEAPAPTTPRGRRVAAIAEVLFATREGAPPPARIHWLCARTEELLRDVRGNGVRLFRVTVWMIAVLGPLLVLSVRPFHALPLERRARALERWERGPAGMTFYAVKAILCILYFEHPEVARASGFDGACANAPQAPGAP